MPLDYLPAQHPQRAQLHNEIHARPPEALAAPVAIAHIVMWADAAQREASRAHLAALLRDQHQAMPDAHSTHLRANLGGFRLRWELHTEFVTWTFSVPLAGEAWNQRTPAAATEAVRVPGVNHLLVPATTGEVSEYASLSSANVSPDATGAIAKWLTATFAR